MEKPNLGLVDYHGNKDNNLVATNCDNVYRTSTVLYDPQDPRAIATTSSSSKEIPTIAAMSSSAPMA